MFSLLIVSRLKVNIRGLHIMLYCFYTGTNMCVCDIITRIIKKVKLFNRVCYNRILITLTNFFFFPLQNVFNTNDGGVTSRWSKNNALFCSLY